jgi:putative secretion ATPase (PEP-CTERM system associated)
MYERFFQLRERPFALSPDPDYLYPSRVHREALGYLRYGIESQAGFVVITGEIGSGKTTLLQALLRGLDGRTTVVRLMNTLLDPRELLEAIAIDLGIAQASPSKPALLHALAARLVDERQAGRLVLLVIDEAQNLGRAALEELRMLSNLETEKSKLIQLVLVGQPDLRDTLNQPSLVQLRQRVTVSYHLGALDPDETAAYVNHRLRRASLGPPLQFTREVTDLVHARSRGVPRLINVICDAALVFAYAEERRTIDPALIAEAVGELQATGVLRPSDDPAVPAVPTTPRAEEARPTTGDGGGNGLEAIQILMEKEAVLRVREEQISRGEQQLAEQRRVLAEEYQLFRTRQAREFARASVGADAAAPAWPPTRPVLPEPAVEPGPADDVAFRHEPAMAFDASAWPDDTPRQTFWGRVRERLRGGARVSP